MCTAFCKQKDAKNMIPAAALMIGAMAASAGAQVISNNQQRKQQERLNEQSRQEQEKLNASNQKLQMQTWKDTGMPAQAEQLRKAGMNPGLMYSQGGSQPQMGSPGGNISGGQASAPNLMMNAQELANIELTKAQTDNVKADTAKKTGADTANVNANTANVIQQTNNAVIDGQIKQFQKTNEEVRANVNQASQEAQIKQIEAEAAKTIETATQQYLQNQITAEAKDNLIQQVALQNAETRVNIAAKQAGTELTQAQTAETAAKIQKIAAEVARMQAQTDQGLEEIMLKRMQTEFNTSTPAQIKQWTEIGVDISHMFKRGNTTNNTTNNHNPTFNTDKSEQTNIFK